MNLSCKTGAKIYGGTDFEKCLLQNKNLWQKKFNTWKDFEQKVGTKRQRLKDKRKTKTDKSHSKTEKSEEKAYNLGNIFRSRQNNNDFI